MKVLINRSDAIGDTLLTIPMAARIKEDYPQAEIIFIISPKCVDLFKDNPLVDDVWILNHKTNFLRKFSYLWGRIGKFQPDAFFHVGGSFLPAIVAWMKRLNFRGGLKSKWPAFLLLNKGVHQMRSTVTQHESDYNLNLLEPLGIQYDYNKRAQYEPKIHLDSSLIFDNYQEFLQEYQLSGNDELIFIHPGMSGHTLNWSSRNYARLIDRFEKNYPGKYKYIISYTPTDEPYLEGIKAFFNEPENEHLEQSIIFFNGAEKGLYYYMTILHHAKLFIGPSTGTTHIANALGIKVIGLYSPIKVQSTLRWAPFDRDPETTKLLVPDVVCGEQKKCAGRTCPYYECMAKIEVAEVFKAASELGELAKSGD